MLSDGALGLSNWRPQIVGNHLQLISLHFDQYHNILKCIAIYQACCHLLADFINAGHIASLSSGTSTSYKVCVCVCVHACVRACVRACVCVLVAEERALHVIKQWN